MWTHNIIYKKIKIWEDKPDRKALRAQIYDWLRNFPKTEKNEILKLFKFFDYYTKNKLPSMMQEMYKEYTKKHNLQDSLFCKIEKNVGVSYSNAFFCEFWIANRLYNYSQNELSRIAYDKIKANDIVIVDDFFGTGETIKDYLTKIFNINSLLKNKNWCILALHGTKDGEANLKRFANQENICLDIITLKSTDKAFAENYIFPGEELKEHKNKYLDIYKKYFGNDNRYSLGFLDAEALVSFSYNSPNDTLGLFWQDSTGFRALFPRVDKSEDTSLSQINKKRKIRRDLICCIRKKYNVDDNGARVLLYFYKSNGDFDAIRACEFSGVTDYQLVQILNGLEKNDYIKLENGRYMINEKVKRYLAQNKLMSKCVEDIEEGSVRYMPKTLNI